MDGILNFDDLNIDIADLDNVFSNEEEINTEKISNNKNDNTSNDETEIEDLALTNDNFKTNNTTNAKPDNKVTNPSSNNEDSTISVFARMLQEEGVLPLEDSDLENVKSVEDLKETIKDSIAKYIETKKYEGLNESQKRFLGAVEAGIPQNEFEKLESNLVKIENNFSDDILEQDQNARFNILATSYMLKGFSKDKAIKMANASFNMQTDIEDAKEARDILYTDVKNKYDSMIEQKKEEHKVGIEKLKEQIDQTETVLGSLKLTPKMKEEIHKNMVTKIDSDDEGKPLNKLDSWVKQNPTESKIILNALYVATNGFKNLGKLGEVARQKSATMLEEKLRQAENLEFMNNNIKINGKDFDISI